MQTKKIISINGPVILAKGDGDFSMHDIVYIGKEQILGDVIKINKDIVTIQVLWEIFLMEYKDHLRI